MKHWQQLNIDERLDVLAITSARTKLPQLVVEKDWWVTMVLKALSTTRYFSLMSFKGGTLHSGGAPEYQKNAVYFDIPLVCTIFRR